MSFCDHCEGQRFDRARMLRLLRKRLRECPVPSNEADALTQAINAIRSLDIPHLERLDDSIEGEVIH